MAFEKIKTDGVTDCESFMIKYKFKLDPTDNSV